jgi:hypothetical protein
VPHVLQTSRNRIAAKTFPPPPAFWRLLVTSA